MSHLESVAGPDTSPSHAKPDYGRNPFRGLVGAARALVAGGPVPMGIMVLIWLGSAAGPLALTGVQAKQPVLGWSLYAGVMLLTILLTVVQLAVAFKLARHERPALGAALKLTLRRILPLIGLGIVSAFMVMFGYLFFVIPGILALLWLSFSQYAVIDLGYGPFRAIKRSFELLFGNLRHIMGINLLMGFVIMIGVGLQFVWPVWGPFIGQFIVVVFTMLTAIYLIWVYDDLTKQREHHLSSQTVSPGNILAIFIGLVGYMAVIIALIVYAVTQAVMFKDVKTPCYTVSVAPALKVAQNQDCHVVLRTGLQTDEFQPVDEPLHSFQQVSDTLPHQLYPNKRYKRTDLIKPEHAVYNNIEMYVESLHDRDTDEALTVAYLFAPRPYIINGQARQVFVFKQTIHSGDTSQDVGLGAMVASFTTFYDRITWASPSQAIYNANINDAEANYNDDQFTDAIKNANDALAVSGIDSFDRSVALKWLGLAQHGAKNDKAARTALTESLKLFPYDPAALDAMAGIEYAEGHSAQAITLATQAIALDPEDSEAYNVRGLAKADQGNKTGALADLNEALKINPDDPLVKLNIEQIQ